MQCHTNCNEITHEDTGRDQKRSTVSSWITHKHLQTLCSGPAPIPLHHGGMKEKTVCFHSLELWPYKPNYVFPSNPPTSPLKNKLLVKSLELPQARPATPLHMKCVRPAHFVTIQRTALMKFAKGPHLKGERREICPGWVSAGAL